MKLFKKFFFTTSIIILVSLTILTSILSFAISNYFTAEKFRLLEDSCEAVSYFVSADMNSVNFKRNLYNIISTQNQISDIDVFVADNKGLIVLCGCSNFHTEMPCKHSGVSISHDVLSTAAKSKYLNISNLNGLYSNDQYICGTNIISPDGRMTGYIFATASTNSLRSLMKRIFNIYIISAIIPLIMMLIAVLTISFNQTKPLKLMSEAAKSMANGDFSKRIPVMNDDEIGELSVSFNNMTEALSKAEAIRRSFIGNVSHELRTPMTTIAGFIDGIIDGTIPQEKHKYYLDIISEEVKRLSRVVESMLNISRLESGTLTLNKTKFDLTDTVINIVLSRESEIDKYNITVCGLDTLPKCEIFADFDLIYQVMYNLIDNAIKFTNEGGKVSFAIYKNLDNVEFAVKNTGEGIDKEQQKFIFDRFYKIDKSRSNNKNSSGLGLFIVKTIVELHSGSISVESVPDEYTLFRVILPTKL